MAIRDILPTSWLGRSRSDNALRRISDDMHNFVDRELERFFSDFDIFTGVEQSLLPRFLRSDIERNLRVLPRVDISETDNEYIVEAELPGVKEEDIDISLTKDRILTIKGKMEIQETRKERNYHRIERANGSFERSLSLPSNSDTDNINASFKNGVLTIRITKKEQVEGEVKKIDIKK